MARDPDGGWMGGWGGYALERLYLAAGERARAKAAAHAERVSAPVVSIGNLVVGGTGKTPFTLWAARMLLAAGVEVAVVARPVGGRVPGAEGDEIALLKGGLPGAAVFAARVKAPGARAAAAAWEAVGERGPRVVLVDDGFSHRGLARDLDIVLVDALRPLGNGRLVPRGPLREPPTALLRANVLVATRTDRLEEGAWEETRRALVTLSPRALMARAWLAPAAVRDAAGREVALQRGARVVCLSGIARPHELARSAEALGLDVRAELAHGDHHRFSAAERWQATSAARLHGARVLITAKDAARLVPAARKDWLVLEVEWRWREGGDAVTERLLGAARGGAS